MAFDVSTPGSPPAAATAASSLPPPKARRRRWIVATIVAAIVVVGGVAAYLFYTNASIATHVESILVYSPDDACGLADEHLGYRGYNSTGPSPTTLALSVPNLNSSTCTVFYVETNTSGFSLSGTGTPFSIPARGAHSMSVQVTPPGRSFRGDLDLVFL